jgi:O-antigen/teichoic acid export membrane protein
LNKLKEILARFTGPKAMSLWGNVLGALLGIVSFALLARLLPQEDFGIFTVFITILTLLSLARNGLVGRGLIKYLAESGDPEEQRRYLDAGWRLALIGTLLMGGGGGLVMLLLYGLGLGEDFLWYAAWLLPALLSSLPMDMAFWVRSAQRDFTRQLLLRLMRQSLYIMGVGSLVFVSANYVVVMAVFSFSYLLPSLYSLAVDWGQFRERIPSGAEERGALLRFGRYAIGTNLGGNLLKSADTFLIRFLLGPTAVAAYEVALRLVNLIDIPLRALVGFAYPDLARTRGQGGHSSFVQAFEKHAGFTWLLLLPIALVCFLFPEPIVVLFGGAKYAQSADILRIFAVYMAITSIDRFVGLGLDLLNRPKRNFHKVMLMLTVNVLGSAFVLYTFESLPGVAGVTIVTFSTGILFGFWLSRKDLPFRPFRWASLGFWELQRIVKKAVGK